MTTIKELADDLKVGVIAVKRVLREAYPGGVFDSPDRSLSGLEIEEARTRVPAYLDRKRGRSGELTVAPPAVEMPPRLDEVPFAAVMASAGRPRAGQGHRLLVHQDLLEYLQDARGELRRMQSAVQRLMREMLVEGRAQRRVKSTRGAGAGWLRAPLGDNGGYHYYLWHALAGMKPVAPLGLARDEVLLRAVRHHDDTSDGLGAGSRGDYLVLDAAQYVEAVEVAGGADVLSVAQRDACDHGAALSISKGHPGAGKTTLQLERTRRYRGRLLFLTFGEAQRDQAARWLDTYAHPEQETLAWTHQRLLRELDPGWRPAPPLAVAAEELQAALGSDPRTLGPWLGHVPALYGELRAHYWGRALPVPFRGQPAVLDDDDAARAYLERRSEPLGARLAQAAATVAHQLPAEVRRRLFGDLDAVQRLARGLAGDAVVPPALADLDAVLVDEVQDLTLVELLVCALLARSPARAGGRKAAFHVAGDEGQTVRATDFDWGELKNLVNDLLGRPEEFDLPGNVRSPSTITRVINNSWSLYKTMAKSQRPRGYAEAEVDETALGSVLWTELGDASLDELCTIVADTPGAALIYPDARLPDDVAAAAARAGIVHAAAAPEIKGLDFRVAVVLDVGQRADQLYRQVVAGDDAAVVELENRSAVDAIRVAISRATEVLVLVERRLGRDERARLQVLCSEGDALLEGVVPWVPLAELRSRLDLDTADRSELVTDALADFDRTFADDPATGLRIAERARGWLGESNRAASVQGELRRQVYRALGLALLRTALDEPADAAQRFTRANAALKHAREPALGRLALDARAVMTGEGGTRGQVVGLAEHAVSSDETAASLARLAVERVLRRAAGATDQLDERGWERLLDVVEATAAVVATVPAIAELRASLVPALCDWALALPPGRANDQRATRAMALVAEPPPALRGRDAERRGRWEDAYRCYREAGLTADALRVARHHFDDDELTLELARAAGDPAVTVLERLVALRREAAALTAGDLTDHERQRLAAALRELLPSRRR